MFLVHLKHHSYLNNGQILCNCRPSILWQFASTFIAHPTVNATSARIDPQHVSITKVLCKHNTNMAKHPTPQLAARNIHQATICESVKSSWQCSQGLFSVHRPSSTCYWVKVCFAHDTFAASCNLGPKVLVHTIYFCKFKNSLRILKSGI